MPLGSLAAGDTMRARFGVFLTFRDGRILRQHNYDCFDPF
jgi:ketosteroid isomerase-like protein